MLFCYATATNTWFCLSTTISSEEVRMKQSKRKSLNERALFLLLSCSLLFRSCLALRYWLIRSWLLLLLLSLLTSFLVPQPQYLQ